MKNAVALLIALLIAPLATLQAADTQRKPNVVLIYSDDHGWADLGVQRADKDIRTPQLDRLAKEGVSPNCARLLLRSAR